MPEWGLKRSDLGNGQGTPKKCLDAPIWGFVRFCVSVFKPFLEILMAIFFLRICNLLTFFCLQLVQYLKPFFRLTTYWKETRYTVASQPLGFLLLLLVSQQLFALGQMTNFQWDEAVSTAYVRFS